MLETPKTALINELNKVMAPAITAFLNELSTEELAYETKINAVRQQIEQASMPEIAKALKSVVKDMEANRPDASAARRQDAALAVLVVTNNFRLPLQMKGAAEMVAKTSAAPAKGGKGSRMTRATMGKLLNAVLAAFPKDHSQIAISEFAEKVKAEVGHVRSALLRLKRENKVAPSGTRGKGSTWKLK